MVRLHYIQCRQLGVKGHISNYQLQRNDLTPIRSGRALPVHEMQVTESEGRWNIAAFRSRVRNMVVVEMTRRSRMSAVSLIQVHGHVHGIESEIFGHDILHIPCIITDKKRPCLE